MGRSSKEVTVADILSTDHPHITKEHSIESCMEVMGSKNVRYLPVFENDQLIGLFSLIDVIKEINLQQKETIQHLESYIHS